MCEFVSIQEYVFFFSFPKMCISYNDRFFFSFVPVKQNYLLFIVERLATFFCVTFFTEVKQEKRLYRGLRFIYPNCMRPVPFYILLIKQRHV